MNSNKIIVAIDGYSSCGKSTIAKAVAKELNYIFVDTGAMYRATTLFFIRNDVDIHQAEQVKEALTQLVITFKNTETGRRTLLNGEDVEDEIRQMYVSKFVSPVAAIPAVRRAMVAQQQAMGNEKGLVLDGRDIGTVVFPNAEVKLFMTADPDIRTQRRLDELTNKGMEADFETVKHNLLERDRIDTTREDSPLKQAEDAIVIDNSNLTLEEQFQKALNIIEDAIQEHASMH